MAAAFEGRLGQGDPRRLAFRRHRNRPGSCARRAPAFPETARRYGRSCPSRAAQRWNSGFSSSSPEPWNRRSSASYAPPPLRAHVLGRHRVDVPLRHRRMGQHGVQGHAIVAALVVPRDEALVAPEPMHPVPRHPTYKRLGNQTARITASGSTRRTGLPQPEPEPSAQAGDHPLGDRVREVVGVAH